MKNYISEKTVKTVADNLRANVTELKLPAEIYEYVVWAIYNIERPLIDMIRDGDALNKTNKICEQYCTDCICGKCVPRNMKCEDVKLGECNRKSLAHKIIHNEYEK